MWEDISNNQSDLSPEMLQEQAEILSDIIGIKEGKTWEQLHPELTPEERCQRAEIAAKFASLM